MSVTTLILPGTQVELHAVSMNLLVRYECTATVLDRVRGKVYRLEMPDGRTAEYELEIDASTYPPQALRLP